MYEKFFHGCHIVQIHPITQVVTAIQTSPLQLYEVTSQDFPAGTSIMSLTAWPQWMI